MRKIDSVNRDKIVKIIEEYIKNKAKFICHDDLLCLYQLKGIDVEFIREVIKEFIKEEILIEEYWGTCNNCKYVAKKFNIFEMRDKKYGNEKSTCNKCGFVESYKDMKFVRGYWVNK